MRRPLRSRREVIKVTAAELTVALVTAAIVTRSLSAFGTVGMKDDIARTSLGSWVAVGVWLVEHYNPHMTSKDLQTPDFTCAQETLY
ncbi:hypothetical protein E2C01_028630 [Portunus trituberculatus]|uniref:Uncharacterized protein n=1 Tax=Portunus trituberculatus TaxID=210409 RepID=A0A5B7EM15_PORTR|nr:hypothetical protein [Portunus trituberculatus]